MEVWDGKMGWRKWMRADRRYTFLKKLRFGAITALLAVLMVFPAYGQYGGSSEKIRNDFSIRARDLRLNTVLMEEHGKRI